jgi:hypothetical protein
VSDAAAKNCAPLAAVPVSAAPAHFPPVAGRAAGDYSGFAAVASGPALADCSAHAAAASGLAPADCYRGYFGIDHGFRIGGLPFLVVGGYPRFQYNGYWISAVDPWPEYWGDNWYDNDDVYVAYVDNGYYMYNRRYPTSGVAISISF